MRKVIEVENYELPEGYWLIYFFDTPMNSSPHIYFPRCSQFERESARFWVSNNALQLKDRIKAYNSMRTLLSRFIYL